MRSNVFLALIIVGILPTFVTGQIWTTGQFKPVEVIPGTEDIDVGPGMVVRGESVDLGYADLGGLDLSGSIIDVRCLAAGNFEGTLLNDSHLSFRISDGLNMVNTDFSNSYLEGWIMHGNLRGANFTGAEIRAQMDGTSAVGANFEGVDFRYAALNGVNFENANLRNTSWAGVWMHGLSLEGADLTGAIVHNTNETNPEFPMVLTVEQLRTTKSYQDKNLSNAALYLGSRQSEDVDLTGFDLRDTTLTSLGKMNFSEADLRNATISLSSNGTYTNAIINGTSFVFSLTKEQLYSTASYKDQNLRRLDLCFEPPHNYTFFEDRDFSNADFRNQNLRGACFNRVDLSGADFTGAIYDQHTIFKDGPPAGAVFSRSPVGDVDLNGVIDFADFLIVSAHYGERCTSQTHCLAVGDVNFNNRVDFADFLLVSQGFAKVAAVPEPVAKYNMISLILIGIWFGRRRFP